MHARRILGAALAVLVLAHGTAHALDTAAARIACESDVRRLCTAGEIAKAVFGSYGGVIECLRRERAGLSQACRDEIRRIQNQRKE